LTGLTVICTTAGQWGSWLISHEHTFSFIRTGHKWSAQ